MAMKAPKVTICGLASCGNNSNKRQVAVCTRCGRCADCTHHNDCGSAHSGMISPLEANCANGSCINARNGTKVLVCSHDGRCTDCWQHKHPL